MKTAPGKGSLIARSLPGPLLVAGGACAAWFIDPLWPRLAAVAVVAVAAGVWQWRRERASVSAAEADRDAASELERTIGSLRHENALRENHIEVLSRRCDDLQSRCDALNADTATPTATSVTPADISGLEQQLRLREEALALMLSFANEAVLQKDRYRKNLLRLSVNNKREELHHKLSSSDLDEDLARFYRQFDSSFLAAFPDFLDRFNKLLSPADRQTLKPDGSLPSEVRVIALMRLGFSDSKALAAILNVSVATVYNYRSRYKARLSSDSRPLESIIADL